MDLSAGSRGEVGISADEIDDSAGELRSPGSVERGRLSFRLFFACGFRLLRRQAGSTSCDGFQLIPQRWQVTARLGLFDQVFARGQCRCNPSGFGRCCDHLFAVQDELVPSGKSQFRFFLCVNGQLSSGEIPIDINGRLCSQEVDVIKL